MLEVFPHSPEFLVKSKSLLEQSLHLIFFLESEQSNSELDDVNSMKIAVEERHPKFHRDQAEVGKLQQIL